MGVKLAEGPKFYERVLNDPRNASWLPLDRNPYRPLYEATAALVPEGASVVELGCGTGRLAPLILARARSYVGIDFAPRLIREAKRYEPRGWFVVGDLRQAIPEAEVYVANEVLEHLDDDVGLLRRLPLGSVVIVSVPSFDSKSHVRWFPERGQAAERYGEVLAIDHTEYVMHGKAGRFFSLLRGVRA